MDIGEIISEAIRYPIGDMDNIKYPLIVFGLLAIPMLLMMISGTLLENSPLTGIFGLLLIIGLIAFILIAPGYLLSVIQEGIERSGLIPSIEIGKNIINTIKLFVISFVYNIIPAIIIFILFYIVVGTSSSPFDSGFAVGILIVTIIGIILGILFGVLLTVATLRFAKTDSMSEALSFSEVFEEAKTIGIGKIIAFIIVMGVISAVISLVGSLISIIPIIGVCITILVIYTFIGLFESYAVGLLYSDVE